MANRLAICALFVLVLLAVPAATAQADTATQLPFSYSSPVSVVVDPSAGHVFVSGGEDKIVVLNYDGAIVKTIAGENGASGMALDAATHTLYVALTGSEAISEIDTRTLVETTRFSTFPYANPSSLVIAGGELWFSCYTSVGGCVATMNLDGSGLASSSVGGYGGTQELLAAGGTASHLLAVAALPPLTRISVYDVSGTNPRLVSSLQSQDAETLADMTLDPSATHLLLAGIGWQQLNGDQSIASLATSTLQLSVKYLAGANPVAVAVSADGKYIAVGSDNDQYRDVLVYPAGSTKPVRTWEVGSDSEGVPLPDASLAFSPDASRLFVVAYDQATKHLVFHVLDKPTVRPAPTTTKLTRSAKAVQYGSRVKLKVQIRGTKTGTVDLYSSGSLLASHSLRSGATTFTVRPKMTSGYSAKLEQGVSYASSTSHEVEIHVRPIVRVGIRQVRTIKAGHQVVQTNLIGTTRPPRPTCSCGKAEAMGFGVQRRVGVAWRKVLTLAPASIGPGGVKHAWFYTNVSGLYRVRAVYTGDGQYLPSTSAWKKFRVH